MNLRALLLIFLWGSCLLSYAQERDTTYIQPYSQEIWLRAYTPTKMLILTQGKKAYSPNYPFSLGVGIGLRKILGLNILYAQNLFRLKNKTNLKTRSIDIQAHKYGKRILIDAYYQDYTGFYIDRGKGSYTLFPTLSTQQIGVESTYVWRADKFSARAAFEQSECQVKSAGSLLFGSGFYWHRTFMGGLNFGNQMDVLQDFNIKIYPTSITRFSFVYLKDDWTVALSGIFNNKSVYPMDSKPIRLITPSIQLSFTKHFYLKKKNFLTRLPSLKARPILQQNG
ncbi:DUF4421 family protein [Capnocytophaga sputigena]|uniref:DUF4421 family protein n=1 Tax=Capnocytophaga sputigena TaxID=1019 RepID=UPI0028E349DF|nr:DUF4421 family protein [Capnocytophaga sputigena]